MADVTISTIQDLVAFSNGDYGRGSSGSPISVVLTADVDFADLKEYDVPYNWPGCTGTWYINFDGQGHKVDNIYYNGTTAAWGFFNTVYGSIKNLKLTNIYVLTTNAAIGGILLNSGGVKITNCHVAGHLETMGSPVVAGICNTSVASGTEVGFCSVSGLLKSVSDALGLVGNHRQYGLYLYSSNVHADITANNGAPFCSENVAVTNCAYRGTVKCRTLFYGYNASLYTCYYVINADSSYTYTYNAYSAVNCYYDNTVWPYTMEQLTPATTEELHDETWLKEHYFAK